MQLKAIFHKYFGLDVPYCKACFILSTVSFLLILMCYVLPFVEFMCSSMKLNHLYFTFRVARQVHFTQQQLERLIRSTQPSFPWGVPQVSLHTPLPVHNGLRELLPVLQRDFITFRRKYRRPTHGITIDFVATPSKIRRIFG